MFISYKEKARGPEAVMRIARHLRRETRGQFIIYGILRASYIGGTSQIYNTQYRISFI